MPIPRRVMSSTVIRWSSLTAVSFISLVGACVPRTPEADGGSSEAGVLSEAVMASITADGLERHARAIVQYERPSGGPGESTAIDSVVASLREAGVPVEVYAFDTYGSDPVSAEVRVPSAGLTLRAITMAYSGPARGLRGRLVDVGTLSDLPDLERGTGELLALQGAAAMDGGDRRGIPDLTGAIAVVVGQPRNVPTAALALLGAEGVIFTNPEERLNDLIVTSTWGTPSLRNYDRLPSIPTVQVTKSDGDRLRSLVAAGPVTAEIDAEVSAGRRTLRLAVARIEGPTPDAPYVLLGGHIDGWYHGATDEGASNAAMVELARAFHAERGRMKRGLVVAWWPGHSNARYAGSTWFADHFFEELRDRAVAYMNIDGVGQTGAVRISSTATASMDSLAGRVARDAAGLDDLPGSTPGRNSDQSFNGVGLPLLQFNHTRSSEDGGYWWWHTPEDTYDKIDLEVLRADTELYARAIAHLTADPVLPVDLAGEIEALGRQILRRAEEAVGRLDLAEAIERQARLLESVQQLTPPLAGHEGPELDRAMISILRPVYRVMYDPVDPFHPDPGFSVGLLPGLAPVTILAEEDPASDRYLFAETTLVRERNRLMEALDVAIREAEALGRMVGA
jgi:N-acetylated-alpha-linked acidic dipeptidase